MLKNDVEREYLIDDMISQSYKENYERDFILNKTIIEIGNERKENNKDKSYDNKKNKVCKNRL